MAPERFGLSSGGEPSADITVSQSRAESTIDSGSAIGEAGGAGTTSGTLACCSATASKTISSRYSFKVNPLLAAAFSNAVSYTHLTLPTNREV